MRVVTVIGNRPQFVKAAAVSDRLRAGAREVLVHTGQHYDDELSRVFFDELELPRPDHQLDVGGGTNTSQTARMLERLEPLLAAERPDALLIYGDTNSTLAGALAGAQAGVPVAHVEAGMRSYDRTMPEELNRVLADHASSLLLCSSERAAETLLAEGVAGAVVVVGDVMVDVANLLAPRARVRTAALEALDVRPGEYLLATAHRAGNVDDPARLARLVEVLLAVPGPVVLPLHPRTRARLEAAGLLARLAGAGPARAAARLPRLHGAAAPRAGGAHRLGWRAEGGLPGRGPVSDPAVGDRVDGDRRGGLERARGSRRRGRRAGAGAAAAGRTPAALRRRPGRRAGGGGAAGDDRVARMSDPPLPQRPTAAPETPGYTTTPPPGAGGPPIASFGQSPVADRMVLAGWWSRVGAAVIDGLIVGIGGLLLLIAITAPFSIGFFADDDVGVVSILVGLSFAVICVSIMALLYAPALMARTDGKTLGRMAVGIRVVRAKGEPMTFGFAMLREVAVKALLFGIAGSLTGGLANLADVLWPLWDEENRALHDFVVDTRVVKD